MARSIAAPLQGFSRRIPLIVAAAFFMETLDGTIVTTALPAMAADLHRSALDMTSSVSIYLMAVAVFIPAAGWASDRFGSRWLFASAVGVFTLASLLCALSPSATFLFAARGLQGTAAAFMSPVGRLVVLRESPKQYLIEAIAIITWPALVGPVVGPPLAGVIVTYVSWRWIFLLNLPIGLAGLFLVLRYVPNHRDAASPKFDVLGFLLTGAALTALIAGLGSATAAGLNVRTMVIAVLTGGAFAVGSVWHAMRHRTPMLDLTLGRVATFSVSTLTAGMVSRVAIGATPFLLPLMFQLGFGTSAIQAGVLLLVYMLGNLGMKSITTPLLHRFGFRPLLLANGYVCAAAIAGCGFLTPSTDRAVVYGVLLLAGMTRSMHLTASSTLAFADIHPSQRAGASTLASMMIQLSFTLGVTFGAVALAVSERWRGAQLVSALDFQRAFLAAGVAMALATTWTLRLPSGAGAELAGRA